MPWISGPVAFLVLSRRRLGPAPRIAPATAASALSRRPGSH